MHPHSMQNSGQVHMHHHRQTSDTNIIMCFMNLLCFFYSHIKYSRVHIYIIHTQIIYNTVDMLIFTCLIFRNFFILGLSTKLRIREFPLFFSSAIIIIIFTKFLNSQMCPQEILENKTSRILPDLQYIYMYLYIYMYTHTDNAF